MNADRDTEIAKRAYHFWEAEGRPDGKALDHWLRAEAEFPAEAASQTGSEVVARPEPMSVETRPVPEAASQATSVRKPARPAPVPRKRK